MKSTAMTLGSTTWVILASSLLTACGGSNDTTIPTVTTPTVTTPTTPFDTAMTAVFPRSTEVFGVKVRATASSSDVAIKHAAAVMAQYLDNNEDGVVDNEAVVAKLVEKNATLIIGVNGDDIERAFGQLEGKLSLTEEQFEQLALQNLTVSEIHPNGAANGMFDASLEEVLHLITHEGYAAVYPDVFGEKVGSQIADAMDVARGGQFETIPNPYPDRAWYSYDDETCDYSCMITEYTFWSLTSILGAQQFEGRLAQISEEWSLNTKAKVMAKDLAVYNILTNGSYALATKLPDGNYKPRDFEVSGAMVTPGNGLDSKKAEVFAFITEQTDDSLAVYGSHNVEQASYDRVVADVKSVLESLDTDIKQGLLNAGAKMLVVENEEELEANIEYFVSLLPVEAMYTNIDNQDETIVSDRHYGLSNTKLELMYLIVYYSLLTEDSLPNKFDELTAAYNQATTKNLFTPDEAYQDGEEDEIHQNASDQNALKYGSYLYNLYQLRFGNDIGVAGEFTITTKVQLKQENPLGYAFVSEIFGATE